MVSTTTSRSQNKVNYFLIFYLVSVPLTFLPSVAYYQFCQIFISKNVQFILGYINRPFSYSRLAMKALDLPQVGREAAERATKSREVRRVLNKQDEGLFRKSMKAHVGNIIKKRLMSLAF